MMGVSKKIDGGEGGGEAKQAEMEKKVSNNEDKRTILYIFVFIFVSGKKDSRISGVSRSVINRECPIKI